MNDNHQPIYSQNRHIQASSNSFQRHHTHPFSAFVEVQPIDIYGVACSAPSCFRGKGPTELLAYKDLVNKLKAGYLLAVKKLHQYKLDTQALEMMLGSSADCRMYGQKFFEAQTRDSIASGKRETQEFLHTCKPKFPVGDAAKEALVNEMMRRQSIATTQGEIYCWSAKHLRETYEFLIKRNLMPGITTQEAADAAGNR
jgi:hypothetical protein